MPSKHIDLTSCWFKAVLLSAFVWHFLTYLTFLTLLHFCHVGPIATFATNCYHLRTFATVCDDFRMFVMICNDLRLFATICDRLLLFATVCNHLRSFATICDRLRQFVIVDDHLRSFATVCTICGICASYFRLTFLSFYSVSFTVISFISPSSGDSISWPNLAYNYVHKGGLIKLLPRHIQPTQVIVTV